MCELEIRDHCQRVWQILNRQSKKKKIAIKENGIIMLCHCLWRLRISKQTVVGCFLLNSDILCIKTGTLFRQHLNIFFGTFHNIMSQYNQFPPYMSSGWVSSPNHLASVLIWKWTHGWMFTSVFIIMCNRITRCFSPILISAQMASPYFKWQHH